MANNAHAQAVRKDNLAMSRKIMALRQEVTNNACMATMMAPPPNMAPPPCTAPPQWQWAMPQPAAPMPQAAYAAVPPPATAGIPPPAL